MKSTLAILTEKSPTAECPYAVEMIVDAKQVLLEEKFRFSELSVRRRLAERLIRRYSTDWRRQPEVTGVSVGYRTKLGQIVSPLQIVIDIDVDRKYGVNELPSKSRKCLPKWVAMEPDAGPWIPIKVRERNYLSCLPAIAKVTSVRAEPSESMIIGGLQISTESEPKRWGTLGICVPHQPPGQPQIYVAITNEHVVGKKGTRIQTPTGVESERDVIGEVSHSVRNSNVDAAVLTEVASNRPFGRGIMESGISDQDTVLYFRDKDLSDRVNLLDFSEIFKVGACTGEKRAGYILNRRRSLNVPDLKTEFRNVIEAAGFANRMITDQGDSGSVLIGRIGETSKYVVLGLNFAMSQDRRSTFAIPFGRIVSRLRVDGQPLAIPEELLWPKGVASEGSA
ncbi:MAG: hypothetical protein JNL58_24695 [Planctomyces sp.]|nr:hypothetical protein [Planctomyces sp.]